MSARSLESFLARLYTEASFRREFLADRARVAREAGLDEAQVAGVLEMDRAGLELAAESYRRKRAAHGSSA